MALSNLNLPQPDSLLLQHSGTVYKFKMRWINSQPLPCGGSVLSQQLEKVVRVLIHPKIQLPIKLRAGPLLLMCRTADWPPAKDLLFKQNGKNLNVCPLVYKLDIQAFKETSDDGSAAACSVEESEELRWKLANKPEHQTETHMCTSAEIRSRPTRSSLTKSDSKEHEKPHNKRGICKFIVQSNKQRNPAGNKTIQNKRKHFKANSGSHPVERTRSQHDSKRSTSSSDRSDSKDSKQRNLDTSEKEESSDSQKHVQQNTKGYNLRQKNDGPVTRQRHQRSRIQKPRVRQQQDKQMDDSDSESSDSSIEIQTRHKSGPHKVGVQEQSHRGLQRSIKAAPSHYHHESGRFIRQMNSSRVRPMQTHRQAPTVQRDQKIIEDEELHEELKLAQMAKSECPGNSTGNKRRSLIVAAYETFISPVKKMFSR